MSRVSTLMATRFANVESISGLIGSGAARPLRFGVVGAVTFGVQLGMLFAFKEAGFGSVIAYALALAVSVQFNFVVNQFVVWHDRPLAMLSRQGAERWVTFHGCIALSLVVNFLAFVVAQMFMADILAALIGVGFSTALKFLSLDRLAFRPAAEEAV
jgi:putative flippase GtrA